VNHQLRAIVANDRDHFEQIRASTRPQLEARVFVNVADAEVKLAE
jgi:hypothetical protein